MHGNEKEKQKPSLILYLSLFPLLIVFMLGAGLATGAVNAATDSPEVRVGSEVQFPPYAFVDASGRPAGFSVDLIKAVAAAMGLPIKISTGPWDTVWNDLVAGRLDVLPIVAKSPERQRLVDFSLPHTETYDAFFVRQGNPQIPNIEAAKGKEIVVMRSDAAHHALLERNFQGRLILVETIPAGLSLISSGKHDAFLCSKLIGTMVIKEHGLKNLEAGPPIPDYKRVFSFAVKKGDVELLEKLNQGLLIIKTNREYDRIYAKWLAAEDPWQKLQKYLWPAIVIGIAVALIVGFWLVMLQLLVKKRTRQLSASNEGLRLAQEGLEERVAQRTGELANANVSLQSEIAERQQAEEALKRQHAILAGINRIFKEALTCETEEKLGETCLAVAEELTGSKAGFIGELNQEGRMDSIAISNLGWEACKIPGSEDLVLPRNFNIHGIYGICLREGRPEIVNDPATHPERVGTPAGHPPITAFLGAPLKHAGKTIGMIGLANKEGGYTGADREAMEALAPVVVEAFMRQRAEVAQRESEAQLRTIFDSLTEGVVVSTLDGQLVAWNQAAMEMHGYSRLDEVRRPLAEFADTFELLTLGGEALPLEQWPLSRILRGEQLRNLEVRVRHRHSGWERTTNYSGALVRDQDGAPLLAIVSMADISDCKRAEAALRRLNEELERRVVERTAALEASVVQLEEEINEREQAERQAANLGRLYRLLSRVYEVIVHAQDQEGLFREACRIMMKEGDFLLCWIGLVDRDARLVRAAAQHSLIDDYPQNITISLEDVPESRGPTGVAVREGRWDLCQDIAGDPRMAPWRQQALARGFRSSAAFPLFVGGKVAGVLSLYAGQQGFFNTAEVSVLNSLAQDLSFAMEAMDREAGRRQAEEEVHRLNEKLEQRVKERTAELEFANRELESFSYSVSHDLKAPIRAIQGFSRMLMGAHASRLDEEGLRLLDVIVNNTQMMANLINDLLALSRLGRHQIRKSAIDLAAMARQVFEQLHGQEPERDLWLTIQDLPHAWGDPALIKQVMMNLLGNAVKYTKAKKTAVIEVGGHAEGRETIYYVKDNGVGFDDRYVDKLFGVFQRLHGGPEYEGTGVGLAIVQRIIQRHGGRVWAEGKVGEGAAFYVSLPK